jgi:hypothetical protein
VTDEAGATFGRSGPLSQRGQWPTFERFRDGWLLVYPDGAIGSRHVMTEETARAMARLADIEFPGDHV